MSNAAMKMTPTAVQSVRSGSARAVAVAKFRELADKLERGELEGARIQWREGLEHIECVELDYNTRQVRFTRVQIEEEV
jgi:hypothetical protein